MKPVPQDPPPELSTLKQEVAELWSRYRSTEPPLGGDDAERLLLKEKTRLFEATRRLLAERRTSLRERLEVEGRRRSRFLPLVQGLGVVLGLGLGALGVAEVVPEVAAWSVGLSPAVGAVLVGVALFSVRVLRP